MRNFELTDFIESIDGQVQEFLSEHFETVQAADLGFDPRSAGTLWVNTTAIVKEGDTRSFDYYGGMEYVDASNRKRIGSFTFYLAEGCERVTGHLARKYHELEGEEEDED